MDQQRLCLACSTPFEVPATSRRKYCSVACQPRQSHSTRARPPVTVACGHCGKEFERKAWVAEQQERLGRKQYCSVECRDTARRGLKGTQKVERITKTCPRCGNEFGSDRMPSDFRRQKYCSRKCAGLASGGRHAAQQKYINNNGYVMIYVPPEQREPGQKRYAHQPEHRMVMAETLGRRLAKHETVHHINGDRTDNRPENLQVRNGHHGAGHILRCRSCGSSDIEHVEL